VSSRGDEHVIELGIFRRSKKTSWHERGTYLVHFIGSESLAHANFYNFDAAFVSPLELVLGLVAPRSSRLNAKQLKTINKVMRARKINRAPSLRFVELLDRRAIWLTLYKSMTTLTNNCPRLSRNLNGDCRRSSHKTARTRASFWEGLPAGRSVSSLVSLTKLKGHALGGACPVF